MKICDITMAYNAKSGGIKTYIDEKRRFLLENTDHEHLLIVPGARDRVRRTDRTTTITIRAPRLPGQDSYRFFLSPAKVKLALREEQPDLIELGSYYTETMAAFSYRRRRRAAGLPCLLGAYFHTDVAEAYVAAPIRAAAHSWFDDLGDTALQRAGMVADFAASRVAKYIRHVFGQCDVALAASPAQAARLREYGVDNVAIAPMGVDLDLFNPGRRSDALRARYGAQAHSPVLIYAGRLCAEKRVGTLLEAFQRLPPSLQARLWILGDGPLRDDVEAAAQRDPRIHLLPYQTERERFAELLASADLYATAGPFETFALSVVEAQASGLPVVGVDAGALRERVEHGRLGFLGPADDAQAMAENIARASQARPEMSAAARRHVAERMSWTSAFERWLACYEAPIAAPQARAAESAAALLPA